MAGIMLLKFGNEASPIPPETPQQAMVAGANGFAIYVNFSPFNDKQYIAPAVYVNEDS